MDQNNLFQEFAPVTRQQWEDKIEKDLKGADRNRKLIWKNIEGFNVEPYYLADDHEKLSHTESLPNEFPFIRGNKCRKNDWEIRQDIEVKDIKEANTIALRAIKNGATGIGFKVKEISEPYEMKELLNGIDVTETAIHFISSVSYPILLKLFLLEVQSRKVDTMKIKGSFNFDPISYYLQRGEFYNSWEDNINEMAIFLAEVEVEMPRFKAITVNGNLFHNAGSTLVQELAFSLSVANEYMANLCCKSLSADDIAKNFQFSFAIGSSYFMEIAKFRAARMLWANILDQYKVQNPEHKKAFIHAVTSNWNKTVFDPYVNMLRTTTETMSGAIAGVDSITVNPFDSTYKASDEFSRRIARNQQVILKEESYLNKVIDPGAGSYYIEQLTDSIAQAAWELFIEIEEKGGFLKAVEEGFIHNLINESCQKRDMNIATRKTIFLGTNQYPNLSEAMLEKIEALPKEKDSILKQYRGAQAFESLRLSTEKFIKEGNKKPAVFMLPIGNLAMRKARSMFATNFFGCAGYEIIDNNGFTKQEEAIKKALESNAEIIVICSSDDEYPELVPSLTKGIKQAKPSCKVVVAGYPKDHIEAFKNDGVDDFIHVKTNVLEALNGYQKSLGVIK